MSSRRAFQACGPENASAVSLFLVSLAHSKNICVFVAHHVERRSWNERQRFESAAACDIDGRSGHDRRIALVTRLEGRRRVRHDLAAHVERRAVQCVIVDRRLLLSGIANGSAEWTDVKHDQQLRRWPQHSHLYSDSV